ncbi:MAG: hypothetical protein DBX48_03985 [Limosilactobacillus fermentum]|nr:MAG: hypothetical protein DBX48_03985 [Limosilactobacillus fermentum]
MKNKVEHLELIQKVINRMANNSFLLKGWAVTLVAGIFALSSKDADKLYFLVVYIPVLVFWILDTYYLLQERLYCSLYNKVREMDEENIDFLLTVTQEDFPDKRNKYWNCFISTTEVWFYLPLVLVCTGIIIITNY